MLALSNWINGKKNLPCPGDILIQIVNELEKIHDLGRGHGNVRASNIFLDETGTRVLALDGQRLISDTQNDDIFELGCLIYQVITGGLHPFGQPDNNNISLMKDLNLYDLSECDSNRNLLPSDVLSNNMQQLIKKMICRIDPGEQRPKIQDLRKEHPIIWSDATIVKYLRNNSNKELNSEDKWTNAILLSNERDETSSVLRMSTVGKILSAISQVCKINKLLFPVNRR